MFNNLLRTLLGGAGQGIQKIVGATQQQQKPANTYSDLNFQPRPQTQPVSAARSLPMADMTSRNSVPSAQPFTTGLQSKASSYVAPQMSKATSTSSTPSNFMSKMVSSLMPKAYADDGLTPAQKTSDTLLGTLIASNPLAQLYSKTRQGLSDIGIIDSQAGNFGALVKNALAPHMGNWGSQDYGATEFLGGNTLNYITDKTKNMGVNKINSRDVLGLSDNTNLRKNIGDQMSVADKTNAFLKQQEQGYNKDVSSYLSGSGGGSSYGGGTGGAMAGTNNTISGIDADTNAALDQLYEEYASGNVDQEEYIRRSNELQQAAKDKLYSELIAQQDAELPLIESEFQAAKSDVESVLPQQKAQAEKIKTLNTNTYQDAMRKMVKNAEMSKANVNNVAASLGTAGSSHFLNKIGQIEQDKLNNVGDSEKELSGKISDIDNSILTLENNIKSDVNKLILEKEKQIAVVNNNKRMSLAQKAAATDELNAQLYQQLGGLRDQRDQQKQAFLSMKANIVANSGELLKKSIVDDSLYGRVNPVQSYNSGQSDSTETGNSRVITQSSKKYNPFKGGQYILNPETGAYEWVNLLE